MAMQLIETKGTGKPDFGKTHMVRQRRNISLCLCDVCGKPLKAKTKISMSMTRAVLMDTENGVDMVPLVVEPLCCRDCAIISIKQCPHLKKTAADGSLKIRQVFSYTVVMSMLTGEATEEFAGVYEPFTVGHLKMRLDKFTERDMGWLG